MSKKNKPTIQQLERDALIKKHFKGLMNPVRLSAYPAMKKLYNESKTILNHHARIQYKKTDKLSFDDLVTLSRGEAVRDAVMGSFLDPEKVMPFIRPKPGEQETQVHRQFYDVPGFKEKFNSIQTDLPVALVKEFVKAELEKLTSSKNEQTIELLNNVNDPLSNTITNISNYIASNDFQALSPDEMEAVLLKSHELCHAIETGRDKDIIDRLASSSTLENAVLSDVERQAQNIARNASGVSGVKDATKRETVTPTHLGKPKEPKTHGISKTHGI